ncbi:uncharacterized protein LOC113335022 [Papaver somniferum]|uniref:uncharacterized protein LOC113335022 n=1 Tax=Papaver somniferum TaxID=3469 RepID=UPI000E6FFDA6|nr:uncharacterized protein LOC113335022 [Papaver somniferum]XP_026437025.1 uncharacterized protein LOC113335022 [Papaver somniferum]XP_026437026.1 uncharacterized protein LOC113335022 [Papaver somniferum]
MIRRVVYQPVRIEISYAMNHLTTMVVAGLGALFLYSGLLVLLVAMMMTKLAIIPFTVLSETLFLNKVCDSELCGSVCHQIVYRFVSLYLSLRKLITCIGADSGLVYNFW